MKCHRIIFHHHRHQQRQRQTVGIMEHVNVLEIIHAADPSNKKIDTLLLSNQFILVLYSPLLFLINFFCHRFNETTTQQNRIHKYIYIPNIFHLSSFYSLLFQAPPHPTQFQIIFIIINVFPSFLLYFSTYSHSFLTLDYY